MLTFLNCWKLAEASRHASCASSDLPGSRIAETRRILKSIAAMSRRMVRDWSQQPEVHAFIPALQQTRMLICRHRWPCTDMVNGGGIQCGRPKLQQAKTACFDELSLRHDTHRPLFPQWQVSGIWSRRQDCMHLYTRSKPSLSFCNIRYVG